MSDPSSTQPNHDPEDVPDEFGDKDDDDAVDESDDN